MNCQSCFTCLSVPTCQEYLDLVQKIEDGFLKVNWIANTNLKSKYNNDFCPPSRVNSCPSLVRWDYMKGDYVIPRFSEKNPEFETLLEKLVNTYYPEVEYNSFMINRNAEMLPHKDTRNRGQSFIMGFGNYTGGELVIDNETDNEMSNNLVLIDTHHKPLVFDGKNHFHYVNPFQGDRFTLVAYYI